MIWESGSWGFEYENKKPWANKTAEKYYITNLIFYDLNYGSWGIKNF